MLPGVIWWPIRYPLNGGIGEGAGFSGSLWSVCIHNIPCLASPLDQITDSLLHWLQSVGHTCGQMWPLYLCATYSLVALDICHCGQAGHSTYVA